MRTIHRISTAQAASTCDPVELDVEPTTPGTVQFTIHRAGSSEPLACGCCQTPVEVMFLVATDDLAQVVAATEAQPPVVYRRGVSELPPRNGEGHGVKG